jgi:hypothetical protein
MSDEWDTRKEVAVRNPCNIPQFVWRDIIIIIISSSSSSSSSSSTSWWINNNNNNNHNNYNANNSVLIYLRANLTSQRPNAELARVRRNK